MESAEKSSGEEGELRRIGLSWPKTSGLISRPIKGAGKGGTFGIKDPHRHFHARGTVGEGLSDSHAAPLPLALRTQVQNAALCVLYQAGIKQVLH